MHDLATNNLEHMKDDLGAGFGKLPDPRQLQRIRGLWDRANFAASKKEVASVCRGNLLSLPERRYELG